MRMQEEKCPSQIRLQDAASKEGERHGRPIIARSGETKIIVFVVTQTMRRGGAQNQHESLQGGAGRRHRLGLYPLMPPQCPLENIQTESTIFFGTTTKCL